MTDWRQRAEIHEDVVYFPGSTSSTNASTNVSTNQEKDREAYLWDLDKTYLDTKVESIKDFFKTAFEKAFQKENIPGTSVLCACLKSYWHARMGPSPFPIFFITASPPQLESKIIRKLNLDGISPKGLFCKDNLRNLKPTRLWRLTQQVGYKLQALLQLRMQLHQEVQCIMWGDDSESDVFIYCLYSDICTRRLDQANLVKTLKRFKVTGSQINTILEIQEQIPENDPVAKIYINLADDTDAEYYIKFGRRCLPIYNSFQTALDLFQDGRLTSEDIIKVAKNLTTHFDFTTDELESSLDDLIRRQVLGKQSIQKLIPSLQDQGLLHLGFTPSLEPKKAMVGEHKRIYIEGTFEPWTPEYIDYFNDYS